MECREIAAEDLLKFISARVNESGLFLQTPVWFDLAKKFGDLGECLGFWDNNYLVGVAVILPRSMRGGFKYYYSPRGPVTGSNYLLAITEILKKRYDGKGLFLRLEPSLMDNQSNIIALKRSGWLKTSSIQPDTSLIVDLKQDETQLLQAMHPKTRYNIRLAQKKDLSFSVSGRESLDDFFMLLKETSQRDGFSLHERAHYQSMLESLGDNQFIPGNKVVIKIAQVKKNGRLLAASLLVGFNKTVVYLHGASSSYQRELMPTYFLHWQTMLEAKKNGFDFYDWWGISSHRHPHSRWQGITRFKLGFGGQIIDYLGAFDYPYHKLFYLLYRAARLVLR